MTLIRQERGPGIPHDHWLATEEATQPLTNPAPATASTGRQPPPGQDGLPGTHGLPDPDGLSAPGAEGGGQRLGVGVLGPGGTEVLTPEYRRIMEIVAKASRPVMAKDVALALGRENTPAEVEPVRGQLRMLCDRGWLTRTGSGRYLPR